MEKRIYPRISKQLSATVANEEGACIKVTTVDTNSKAVCIECNINQRNVITPGGSFVRDGRPVELMISLDLPDDSGQLSPIRARCHILFSRRISWDQCKIGMRYVDIDSQDYVRLVKFIEKTLASNDG
jgi:hypothetical protein